LQQRPLLHHSPTPPHPLLHPKHLSSRYTWIFFWDRY
jgi:hypothetical protein